MSRCILPGALLLMCSVCFASAGIHSHYFYSTATNDLTYNTPLYTMTRTLDDITLFWYDSISEVVERRAPWFQSPFASLLEASKYYHSLQQSMQAFLLNISYDLNQTEGYHILQRLGGCTLYDNGTVQASFSYRYDGKPFFSFNVETASWTAETADAEDYAQDFNSNKTILEENQFILVNMCIPHITELLSLGKYTINRKEAPVVKVAQIPIDSTGVRLYCRAYGHYPKDIVIMWYKDGQPIAEEMLDRVTLPLPDLTYLTSVSFNVTSAADEVYTCRVRHSSMLQEVSQDLRISGGFANLSSVSSNLPIGAVIAICLAIVVILVLIALVSVAFAKTRGHVQFE